MRALIIVDMQNDFITGSLSNPDALNIVDPIVDYIKGWDKKDPIFLTRDTHREDYLYTLEGRNLPIEHCIEGTPGWCVTDKIANAVRPYDHKYVNKPTFGLIDWSFIKRDGIAPSQIILCGTCTDICVISNALILKAQYPDKMVIVMSKLCAGVTPEKHEAALEVMKSCQVEVVEW